MKFLVLFAIGLCSLLSGMNTSAQERRVALVIGNAAYKNSPLANPVNDSRAMAASLKQLGFEVIERENLGRENFAKVVREYGERLKGATVGLFYFAGHGIQVRGRNFLIPVDADIAFEDEVAYRSVDVTEILDKMDTARTSVNVVVLDACRNNPFAQSFKTAQAGLAQIDAPTGTLIAFATAPGSVAQDGAGSNGLYTGALLKHIAAPNLAVEQMFKRVRVDVVAASKNQQVPWESSSLSRDFTFARTTSAASSANQMSSAQSAPPPSDLTLELAFWSEVKNSRDPADYRAYLEQYPSGRFTALAKLRANAASAITTQPLVLQPAPVLASQPAVNQTVISAATPEGLYRVSLEGEQLRWLDAQNNNFIRSQKLINLRGRQPKQLQFSGDGRWMLLSLQSGTSFVHHLIDVASEALVWERTGSDAAFDLNVPQVLLQTAQRVVEKVRLP